MLIGQLQLDKAAQIYPHKGETEYCFTFNFSSIPWHQSSITQKHILFFFNRLWNIVCCIKQRQKIWIHKVLNIFFLWSFWWSGCLEIINAHGTRHRGRRMTSRSFCMHRACHIIVERWFRCILLVVNALGCNRAVYKRIVWIGINKERIKYLVLFSLIIYLWEVLSARQCGVGGL